MRSCLIFLSIMSSVVMIAGSFTIPPPGAENSTALFAHMVGLWKKALPFVAMIIPSEFIARLGTTALVYSVVNANATTATSTFMSTVKDIGQGSLALAHSVDKFADNFLLAVLAGSLLTTSC